MIVWLSLSAITDVIITWTMVQYLRSHRTGFSATEDIVTKLVRCEHSCRLEQSARLFMFMVVTIQTGAITSLWAIIDLVVYLSFVSTSSTTLMISTDSRGIFSRTLCKPWHTHSRFSRLQADEWQRHLIFNMSLSKLYSSACISSRNVISPYKLAISSLHIYVQSTLARFGLTMPKSQIPLFQYVMVL